MQLDGYMYDYSVDNNIVGIDEIINNHKYFMKN